MDILHDHSHGHGHQHGHGHDRFEEPGHEPIEGGSTGGKVALRFALAAMILLAAVLAAASVLVPAGQAVVVTRFGSLVRVLTEPGLAWKLPAPIDGTIAVDLRLRTTTTGMQDVGTKDGLRVLVQSYVAWQVPDDPARVRQFLRAVRNDPDEAARQLRSLVGAALQVVASSFSFDELVDTDPSKLRIGAFEDRLRDQVAGQVLEIYGIQVRQVGVERLSLPPATLAATVSRMRAERETVAAERTAEGLRAAAAIRSEAARDQRITVAAARTQAADIEAASRREAAEIEARAYLADPKLYLLLRSLDTVNSVVGSNTRLILRTDAAPFDVLAAGPPKADEGVKAPPQVVEPAQPGSSGGEAGMGEHSGNAIAGEPR
jgi:membrane protease subunit HflC